MKKMFVGLMLALVLCSCNNTKNFEEVTENTELPSKVIKSLKDTTAVFNCRVITTEDYTYILAKEKNEVVVKSKTLNVGNDALIFWFGFILGILVIFFFCAIIGAFD